MNPDVFWIIVLFALLLIAAALCALVALADRAIRIMLRRGEIPEAMLRPHGVAVAEAPRRRPEPRRDPATVITEPPMIDGVTLREWLVHLHGEQVQPPREDGSMPPGVWASVVAAFYTAAASDPEIADYFRNTNLNRQAAHFLRALDLVASKGITQGTVDYLRRKHAGITASDGTPITGAIYDKVIGALVEVLHAHGVPEHGTAALAKTIAPLRPVIIRA